MAHVFQVESACSSWLQEKWACCDTAGIRDAALLAHQHHHQKTIHHSFSSKGALQQQQPSSFHHLVFCSTSESQARKQISSSSRSSRSPRRPARASKSDAELRRDLQLFLSSRGLPPDKVPSIKELSICGREGLAKIVRRRGYKAIHTLLTDSDTGTSITQESNPVSNVKDIATGDKSNPVSNVKDIATGDNVNDASKVTSDPASHTQKAEQSLNGIARPLKSGISYDSGQVIGSSSLIQKPADLKEDGSLETAPKTSYFLNGSLIDKQADEQLHKRAADFVKTGQLYNLQDSDEDEEEEDNFYEDSSDEDDSGEIWDGHKSAEAIAVEKAAKLQAKLLPLFKSDVAGKLNNLTDESILSILQEQKGAEEFQFCKENTQMGLAFTVEAEVELQNIKSALSSKERELIETSRELEETKAQLALIQAKATAEVAQAKQVALEKDIRLKSADQVLTNLKQVQVEYWGEGGRVELAGSFNGWEYFIFMEPDPTSEISTPDGSRGPLMWETKLWLYPGIYEIKFIVDGHWQIDQRREVVMRNSLHNNILRVEP